MRPLRYAQVAVLAALLAVPVSGARAQASTDEALTQAITLYKNLDVELAIVILRRVVSPSSPFEVSREQRVKAYTYLGATLAILGQADSAIVYFRAALERDPFLDLDAGRFTPREQAALAEARRRTFVIAVRPVVPATWAPAREQVVFSIGSTHESALRVEIQPVEGGAAAVLHDREGDGIREVNWNGMIGGQVAPPGLYQLRVVGRSLLGGRMDSTIVAFALRHQFPPLEDTLPELLSADLLPERHPATAGRTALLKGLALAGVAMLVPTLAGNAELRGGSGAMAATAAGTAVGAGVTALVIRRRNPEIPSNIARNNERRARRAAENAAIISRNAMRLSETKLILNPAGPR